MAGIDKQKKGDMANLNAKIPDSLDQEFEIACVLRKLSKKQAVETALREFISSAESKPIPATCPICKTELLVSPAFVGIESVPGTAEAMMIPPDLRDEIEEFIRFSVSPIVPDIEWRNMMLALFRERAAKRRAGGK